MIITKSDFKILKFVYVHKSTSYKSIHKKFRNHPDLVNALDALVRHNYLVQVGGYQNNLGEPIPITDETLFVMDVLGSAEVESKQWFNLEYVISHLLIPIVLAVISTLITLSLTSALSPAPQTNQEYRTQQELHTPSEIP